MIEYPYLPEGRKILYVSESDSFMKFARKMARDNSTDSMQPTGAVIIKNSRIIASGANQSILKNKKLQELHRKGLCTRKFFKVQSGTKYWLCPGCGSYDSHAEAQSISNAQKEKVSIKGADLYLWGHWWCCKPCWDKMIEAEIKNVYLLEGSERLFNLSNTNHILGKQFK